MFKIPWTKNCCGSKHSVGQNLSESRRLRAMEKWEGRHPLPKKQLWREMRLSKTTISDLWKSTKDKQQFEKSLISRNCWTWSQSSGSLWHPGLRLPRLAAQSIQRGSSTGVGLAVNPSSFVCQRGLICLGAEGGKPTLRVANGKSLQLS